MTTKDKTMKTQNQIGLFRDPTYAPCCFLIIRLTQDGQAMAYRGENERNSVLVQTDYDYPGVARSFGASFEDHQISEAGDWLREHASRADYSWAAEVTAEDPGYFEFINQD